MQAQTHVSNPGLGSRMAQANGSSLPIQTNSLGGTPWRKTWQTDSDVALRRTVVENILQLFQKRRGPVTPEWQQKLPDFVKRLEEALYRNAATKEEYADQQTLESRLQAVAKRMTNSNQRAPQQQHGSQTMSSLGNMMPTPGSTMIPTPGSMSGSGSGSSMMPTPGSTGTMVPTPGTVSNMIPTPGGISSMMPTPGHGMNNMMSSSGKINSMMAPSGNGSMMMAPGPSMNSIYGGGSGNMIPTPGASGNSLVSQQGMGGMRMAQNGHMGMSMGVTPGGSQMIPTPGQMIPTPGLTTTQSIGMNQASSPGLGIPNVTAAPLQQQSQSFTSAANYRNMNGQINSLNSMVQQRKNVMATANGMSNGMQMMGNNQHLMNGNATMHGQTSYLNNQLSSMQVQSQQQQQQQQLQRANQQRQQQQQQQQQMRMQSSMPSPMVSMSESYAMNAADLAGSSSLYPPVSSGGLTTNSLGMNANGSQPAKMIPVPGLPSPLQNSQHLQQARSNFSQSSPMARSQLQQQLQIPKSQGMYQSLSSPNLSSQKLAGSLPLDQSQQQSPSQNMSLPMGRPMFDSQTSSSPLTMLQRQQPVAVQQQQLNMQAQQQQQRQGTMQQQQQQQNTVTNQQQVRQQVSQQSAAQQSRPQQQIQQRSFAQSQQQHRQMLQVPQVQQDLQQQQQQQQTLPSPVSGQQQAPQPQSQSQPHPQAQQEPQQLASANGSAMLMQSAPHAGSTPNGSLPPGQPSTGAIDPQRAQQYSKQQRWLLFLRHASKCTASEGQCNISPHCHMARQLWTHLGSCRERDCQYTRCNASRTLLHHYRICTDSRCPVCGPVKQMINQKRPQSQSLLGQSSPATMSSAAFSMSSMPNLATGGTISSLTSAASGSLDVDLQPPPAKRVKVEPGNLNASTAVQPPQQQTSSKAQPSPQVAGQQPAPNRNLTAPKAENQSPVKSEGAGATASNVPKTEQHINQTQTFVRQTQTTGRQTQVKVEVTTQVKVEQHPSVPSVKVEPGTGGVDAPATAKQETPSATTASTITSALSAKSGKPKIVGTSLTELFTPEMIREHITGLRQWVGQSKAKAEKNQAMEHQMSDNACRLCAVEKLTFEPPPIYCTACGARIKRNALYYTAGSGETRHYFCIPCYNDIRTDTVEMDGQTYLKARLEKRKNDEETEEAWVQCDKCNQWNHQVCALFNGRRNEGGEAEYTCPQCCMSEIERGERKPLQSSAVLGAKDLPKTFLSDHLEQRLARKLKSERAERARALGKSMEEIPGADSLVVRVVSSVDKKLEVKQRFMEIFQEEDYPTEFPYKSKVVLLFQKIEGVEVCLFGMYVQEFGVDCQHPNQRRVYLSYLDSVKYFRPDVRTVGGEALRTYVYHEILIAYLDYSKRRGFSSCYIWACPPLKGEDYILYCHPEIQKTPKSDKLRDWYLAMLKKATSDGIVVEVTNLYDHFFVSNGECKAKVTAARLPYFDGDYWPGAAEDMIVQLQQEEEEGRKLQKKGKNKKTATKRASKSVAQAELASNASKDLQLMYKLGESILPMKEDFIMVHMHYACTHCRNFIVSGYRWTCKQCKNFQICDSCHDAEQKRDERDRHPNKSLDAHQLTPIQVEEIPKETKDKDEFMESEFFDTRQAFLSLCQGNHYQYDTLRRAKHSSMMVLYHLHNPTAPAFVITCNMCLRDIETGAGWRCETCPDFDLCSSCKDLSKHPHKLTPHPSASERNAQNKEARQQRVLQLRKMLDLLVHASQCGLQGCNYPKCRSVKGLFRHGMLCKVRASGGCALCKRMWYLLQLHARACKESECRVPRCKDLKEHVRRSNLQQESRRRAAVMEMMRQRAAEAAGGAS